MIATRQQATDKTPPTFKSVRSGFLQQKCVCGSHTPGGECESCGKNSLLLQRKTRGSELEARQEDAVSPMVREVLHSPGQPINPATRAFFESRFGHDFSAVRVHTDAHASESAQAVNALAYTVGRDVVFDAGRYAPRTSEGMKLLAHELTHVVQQTSIGVRSGSSHAVALDNSGEVEAEHAASQVLNGAPTRVVAPEPFGVLQRQEKKNPLDDKAKAITAKAKDTQVDSDKRAIQLVRDIIAEYYSGEAAKVDSIVFDDAKAGTGLNTQSVGSGATAKGKISLGNYFLNNVDSFARRVLQVGHELQHIDQYRGGLAGGQNKDKREFLAFQDEALAAEKPGTGRLSNATRLRLIDAALSYFFCLSEEDQTAFDSKKLSLLKRRDDVNGKSGNPPIDPPTGCKRQ